MIDNTLPAHLIRELEEIARRENRSAADVFESMLRQYVPSPEAMVNSEDILLSKGTDVAEREAVRRIRARVYEQARRYWQRVGDQTRLALTDEELDEQFWLIDHEGIPRLKSEQGSVELPPGSLAKLAEAAEKADFHSGQSDIVERSREILNTEFADYLLERMGRSGNAQ